MSELNVSTRSRARGPIFGVCASLVLAVAPAFAGEATGTIEFVQAGHGYTPENVFILVQITGSRTNAPGCATDNRMAINPTTNAGKAMLAMLLAAKAGGNNVIIYGTGNCQVMGTEFESISHMRLF